MDIFSVVSDLDQHFLLATWKMSMPVWTFWCGLCFSCSMSFSHGYFRREMKSACLAVLLTGCKLIFLLQDVSEMPTICNYLLQPEILFWACQIIV
ncbi:hypothetical protein VNO78_25599 [Psophocarpus tetragonolobus]|uniref:Uncharacterized protein n=1 Tax=Psophocarpus tetragonolobus TaxID=3891 RepID=A0AAN9XFK2_PSOTE